MKRLRGGFLLAMVFFMILLGIPSVVVAQERPAKIRGVVLGMSEKTFWKFYPRKTARTSRKDGLDEWITFNEPLKGPFAHTVTFHLHQGQVMGWRLDDRDEVITEYLGEFCSQGIIQGMPKIHAALKDVLRRLSLVDFLIVTDRHRPVLITEYYDSGTARFANTSEIIASDEDAPAADRGLTIIKLSSALNDVDSPDPIEGILAHELAHRVLDHVRKGRVTCQDERQANRLIRQWGFAEEFKEASRMFGHKEGDPVSCREE